jgi:hypothetical protein
MARKFSGVAQRPQPPKLGLSTESQLPPEEVVTEVTLKLKLVPVLATVRICGSGLSPPKDLVKDNG